MINLRKTKAEKKVERKKKRKYKLAHIGNYDFPLLFLTLVLVIFGVIMVFSASYYYSLYREGSPYSYLRREVIYAIIGFVLMLFLSRLDYHLYKKCSGLIMVISIILLLLLFTPLGTTVNGATRWIKVGITIMPGEIAKLAMILFGASYYSRNLNKSRSLLKQSNIIAVTALVCVLIILQPNLSTAITVAIIVVGMSFLAEMPWIYVGTMVAMVPISMTLIGLFGKTYHKTRVTSFLDPFKNVSGDGYQVVQSLLALGSGGVTGVGIGKSVEKTLYLPEPHTDFILAIIGEELGLIGIIAMCIVFMLLVWRCFKISMNAPDSFGMLIAGATGITIGVQVVFNIAIVTSSMPPTGVALPFVSYGGNALWIFMSLIGIVLNISRQSSKKDNNYNTGGERS